MMHSAEDAGVNVSLNAPATITAQNPTTLVYRLSDRKTSAPVTDLVLSHERLAHLIFVSRDLLYFGHVHPEPGGEPGEFVAEVNFPVEGSYLLYAEFTLGTGQQIVKRDSLAVGAESGRADLEEDLESKVQ